MVTKVASTETRATDPPGEAVNVLEQRIAECAQPPFSKRVLPYRYAQVEAAKRRRTSLSSESARVIADPPIETDSIDAVATSVANDDRRGVMDDPVAGMADHPAGGTARVAEQLQVTRDTDPPGETASINCVSQTTIDGTFHISRPFRKMS